MKEHQKQYSAAKCKYEKSKIVSFIVSTVRKSSLHGGFVKSIDGAWFEVGDRHAKEKVGQTFRDLLHTKYSSSTKAKARVRLERRCQDGSKTENTTSRDSDSKPEPVPSESSSFAKTGEETAMRSSVSVVSRGSVDVEVDSDALTVVKSNRGPPPLKSVNVTTVKPHSAFSHPGQAFLPQVSPSQSKRPRGYLRRSHGEPFLHHPFHSTFPTGIMPATSASDMEPLPLGESVKVNLNDSSATIQSEESFEDAMSEFYQNLGVAV